MNTVTHVDIRSGNTSNIDLVTSTMAIADNINLQVCDETYGSDHFPIFFTVDANKNSYIKKTFKISTKKTDWSKFEKKLEEKYDIFLTKSYDELMPSQKYDFFVNIISEAIKKATPKKNPNKNYKNSNPVPWWDEECCKIKRLRRAAFKKWQYTNKFEDLIAYNKYCALAKRTFKIKKIESFKKFAQSINLRTNPTYVWNKCKIFKNKWVNVNTNNILISVATLINKKIKIA